MSEGQNMHVLVEEAFEKGLKIGAESAAKISYLRGNMDGYNDGSAMAHRIYRRFGLIQFVCGAVFGASICNLVYRFVV
jgi:hypothetical protein